MEVGLLRLEVREGLLTEVRAGWGLCLDVGSGSDAKAGRGLCVTAARRPARLQRRERGESESEMSVQSACPFCSSVWLP